MLPRSLKPIVWGAALLLIVTASSMRSRAAFDAAPVLEDIPELPAPDGSSDTPEIEVTMLDGKKMKLSSLRGKVCVIDMFASWCPHCQDHAPHMVKTYNQFKAQGFTIVSLATDQQATKLNDIKKFIKDYGLNYPVGLMSNEVMAYYADSRNHSVPQVVLFGKDGKMKKRWIGWSEDNTKELTTLIEGEYGASGVTSAAPAETKPAAPAGAVKDTATKSAAKAPVQRKR